MSQSSASWFDRVRPWLPLFIFAVAFGYRLFGIGWGLPNELHDQSYHPDEQVIWTFSRGVEPAHLHFTPGKYNYGTLYLTLLRISSDMVASYGGGPRPKDIHSLWHYIGLCHLAGRVLSAITGAGTAVVLFLMMRRFTRVLGAFFAAMFVAWAPGFLVHSRFQTVDVLATFLLALSLYYCTLIVPGKREAPRTDESGSYLFRYALLAGLFAGLSAGTKYTGILALASLFTAIALSGQKNQVKALGVGLATALLGFVIATPGVLLDSARFMNDFRYEMLHTSTGHDLLFVNVGSGFLYHLKNLAEGTEPVGLLMAFVAIGLALWSKQKWAIVLFVFSLIYYLLIGRAEVLFLRYTFPLYIILACAFGWWLGEAHEKKGWHMAVLVLGISSLGRFLASGSALTVAMAGMDPRDQAVITLRGLSQPTSKVGIVSDPWFYTPPLISDSAAMRGYALGLIPQTAVENGIEPRALTEIIQLQEMAYSRAPRLEQYFPANDPSSRFDWDSRVVTEMKPDFITFSSFEVGDVWRLRNASNLKPEDQLRVDRFKDFNVKLTANYKLIQPSSPMRDNGYEFANVLTHDLQYIRPLIWIWKRKDLP